MYFEKTKINVEKYKQTFSNSIREQEVNTFKQLITLIIEAKNKSQTTVKIKCKENNNWVTPELLNLIKERDSNYKKYKKNPSNMDLCLKFRKLKNTVNNKIKYLNNLFFSNEWERAGNNTKKQWNIVNHFMKGNLCRDVIQELEVDNKTINNIEGIANKFNDYFSNIGTNIINEVIDEKNVRNYQPFFSEVNCQRTFFLKPTNRTEVSNIVLNLKKNTAPGHDSITVLDVLNLRENIVEILVQLINQIFVSGTFPNELKIVKVCPTHKNGSKKLLNNYRPISLISVFSKIIEMIIKIQMLSFLEEFITPDPYQYGFLKESSTLSATADLINYITSKLDKKKMVLGVFVDLRKAFDVVNHEKLLNKLESMGYRGVILGLIRSYLLNREQYVCVEKTPSTVLRVGSGVPQGSVLGPLLYSLYVLSLRFSNLNARYFTFADDTVLLYDCDDNFNQWTDTINEDLCRYYDWLLENNLKINIDKTKFMLFKQKNKHVPNISVRLNNVELEKVCNIKYLGLVLDEGLGWSAHVDHITNKIIPLVGALHKCKYFLSKNAKYQIYNSFFLSVIRYLIVVWGTCGVTVLNRVKVLQNKVLKILFNLDWFTHSDIIYSTLKLHQITVILKIEQSKFMYKVTSNKLKSNSAITYVSQIHTHGTRNLNNNNIYLENVRTNVALKNAYSEATKTFNSLPQSVKEVRSYGKFIRLIKSHFEDYP